ncbi:MAG: PQQ-binding-like beta-propeller repeat protein [Pirellulaceae bacterium]|nr:PQQ-binding-like beta-propeller repeat protein [Pirellulaceae bacterium]
MHKLTSATAHVFFAVMLFALTGQTRAAIAQDAGEELREVARAGDVGRVTQLLDAGTPVDAPGRHGLTALMFAVQHGHLDVVRLLVQRGANVNAADTFFDVTVLQAALAYRQPDIALYLLQHGAAGRADALQWAAEHSHLALAQAALAPPGVERLDLEVARRAAADKDPAVRDLLAHATPTPRAAPPAQVDPAHLEKLAGKYLSPDNSVVVTAHGGRLQVSIDGAGPIELLAFGDERFENEAGDVRLVITGRAGLVERAYLTRADGGELMLIPSSQLEIGDLRSASDVPLSAAPRGPAAAWRQFRGHAAAGIGDGQGATVDWDVKSGKNIRFKTPIPGIATSSPIIDGGLIFVTTAISSQGDTTFQTGLYGAGDSVDDTSPHSFRLYALAAATGSIVWQREVTQVAPTVKRHLKSSFANSTPATDGRTIVVLFGMVGLLAAYDRDGTEIWRRDIGVLEANDPQSGSAQWGHASSPIVWNDLVVVQADRRRDSFLAAYALKTGDEVWRVPRDEPSTWSTPAIVAGPNGDELVTNGLLIRAYRPRTGELLWTLGPNSEVIVATPVAADGMVFVTGGYPPVRPVYAIRAGALGDLTLPDDATSSAAVAWSYDRGGTYVPTPIVYRGHLVTVNNNGVLTAYRQDDGEVVHRGRIAAASTAFSASPVAIDGRLVIASETGEVYILRGEPDYEVLATHAMDEIVMATPAVSDGLLVIRTLGHVVGIAQSP